MMNHQLVKVALARIESLSHRAGCRLATLDVQNAMVVHSPVALVVQLVVESLDGCQPMQPRSTGYQLV